jgi:hypothetical protein
MRTPATLFALLIAAAILAAALAGYASTPSLPPGRYVTSVSLKETFDRIGMDPMTKSMLPGDWDVWLVEGNRYMIVRNGSMLFEEGRYRLTRQELALIPDATDFPCMLHLRPEWANATYRWAMDDQAIVLTPVQEKCPGRLLVLSLHALVRQD